MANTLVTGGAGFIGLHLIYRLINEGYNVVAFDNFYNAKINFEDLKSNKDFKLVRGDLRNYDQVRDVIKGMNLVVHLGAQSNVMGTQQDLDYCISTNVNGTYNLLKAAAEEGVDRVIFSSSREVYGEVEKLPVPEETPYNCKNPYGVSKMIGEHYCHLFHDFYDLPVVILRLANVFGPGDVGRVIPIFIDNIKQGKPIEIYGGDQILDFVWIDVVVEAIVKALTFPVNGFTINVGSGIGTSIRELANTFFELSNMPTAILTKPTRDIETRKFIADITRIQTLLKIVPEDNMIDNLKIIIGI